MTLEPKDDDLRVIERVLSGDVKAFEILVNKYQKRIYFLAFQKGKNFYTWLYRIAVNLILNYLKHASFTVSLDTPSGRTYLENIPSSPEQLNKLVSAEQMEIFQKALDSLPHSQKTIFMLRMYEDFSYEKISEIMGCSIGTVMSRLFRARNKLKEALKEAEKIKNDKLQK
jgi:RNA polymerase sigma-70 factor (ECF subfamily)